MLGRLQQWNNDLKKWYVNNAKEYYKFIKWIPIEENQSSIVYEHLYVIESIHICSKCNRPTRSIFIGIEGVLYKNPESEICLSYHNDGEIFIIQGVSHLPSNIIDYLQNKYSCKESYSKYEGCPVLYNFCDHCNTLQSDVEVSDDYDSPVWVKNKADVERQKIYKIPLKYDIVVNYQSMSTGAFSYLLKEYGKITELNI